MDRTLQSLLSEHEQAIAKRWLEAVIGTYPAETAKFLRRESDRFANPVGQNIAESISGMCAALAAGDADALQESLDTIVRIRAVQQLSPARAMSFVYLLQPAVQQVAGQAAAELDQALHQLERDLALKAFDIYVACKEKLFEIRVNEMKMRTFKLMERMNKYYGEWDPDSEAGASEPADADASASADESTSGSPNESES